MRLSKAHVLTTLEVWWLRVRFLAVRLVALAGVAIALFGGYLILQPGETVAPASTVIGSLPVVTGFTGVDGALFVGGGAVLVVLATRT